MWIGTIGRLTAPDHWPGLFATMILTGAEVVWLPAASRATAVSVYSPSGTLVVVAWAEYGAAVSSAPRLVPS